MWAILLQMVEERNHLLLVLIDKLLIVVELLVILKDRGPLGKLHIITVTQEAGIGTMYLLLDHPLHICRNLPPYLVQIILIKMVLNRTILLNSIIIRIVFCYTSGFHKPSFLIPGFTDIVANL